MKKHLILLFLVVGIFAVGCNTFGTVTSEAALANRGLETDAQVVTGTLENGLSWVVMENHEPKNRIFLRLIVRAGSVLEDEDQRGIAHLVEHMAFKGPSPLPTMANPSSFKSDQARTKRYSASSNSKQ